MKNAIAFLPFAVLSVFVEIAVSLSFGSGERALARPDLVLVVLAVAALNLDVRQAVLCGLVAGFTLDAFSGCAFGTCSAAYTCAAYAMSRVRRSVAHEEVLSQVLVVFLFAVFVEAACLVRLEVLSPSFDAYYAARTVALVAVMSALAAPVVFQLKNLLFVRCGVLPCSGLLIAGNPVER